MLSSTDGETAVLFLGFLLVVPGPGVVSHLGPSPSWERPRIEEVGVLVFTGFGWCSMARCLALASREACFLAGQEWSVERCPSLAQAGHLQAVRSFFLSQVSARWCPAQVLQMELEFWHLAATWPYIWHL